MTAQTLIDQINKLIEAEIAKLDKVTAANYLSIRKSVLASVRSMWDKAKITPRVSVDTGLMTYVDRAEAYKYGRYDKLTADVKGVTRRGLLTDISNIEYHGKRVYELEYNGMAWVYNQGYGLPITGGARVPLIAAAVYSDYSGNTFGETLKKNWAVFTDDILSTVARDLNQGKSYYQAAKDLQALTDSNYARALRVARTEAHRIQTSAYLDGLALLDEVGSSYTKMWVSSIDSATRDAHQTLDGKEADNRGMFTSPVGGRGPAPGQMNNAADDINCRCSAVTLINGERPTERRIRGEGIVPFESYAERLDRGGDIPISRLRAAK